ncbi:MAG: putative quinol monooxygenase [Novosphingobium sp.]|uniref:putative quinol monooxygenase n=1 Tax=Novosphingobium sp. TaxID=1874826 RepID=UPI0027332DDF|nr:putative quinol monooxygenase [Novosphingobium sp.]MDP3551538.1 putative quinol monooxygenase [Novosphingobium sp.]
MFARRTVLAGAAAALLVARKGLAMEEIEPENVYAIIGQMMAAPGNREELIGYLGEGSQGMPGNLAYQIWRDKGDENSIWITEVWRDEASHKASLGLPQVQEAIRKARPIIAGFGARAEVERVGDQR